MLNNTQLLALKSAILADVNLTTLVTEGATGAIAEYLRGDSPFIVWRTSTPISEIDDAIVWANMTPTDAPDGTSLYTNRALFAQSKQISLQTMVQGQQAINSSKANIRTGLQDALTNLPTGAGGATQTAGWTAVRSTMQRHASLFEKIFATGTGTTGSPGNLVVEGGPDDYSVIQALTQV